MASKFYQMMRRDYIHCDIVIYNTLINIFGRTDKIQQALEFFEMMKKEGIHPNERTYNIPTYSTPYLTIFYPSRGGRQVVVKVCFLFTFSHL